MFKSLISSIRKSNELSKISAQLASGSNHGNILQYIQQANGVNPALEKLMDLCYSFDLTRDVISKYGVDRTYLKRLYHRLLSLGAGQYVRGHFVAASCFAFASPLEFILGHYDGENFSIRGYDDYNSGLFISFKLVEYFRRGGSGPVKV